MSDMLRWYQGNPRTVMKRMGLECMVFSFIWLGLIWWYPGTMEIDPFMVIIPIVAIFYMVERILQVTSLCVLCIGGASDAKDEGCAGCLTQVHEPTRYEVYEPQTLKEKVLWRVGQHIPKASRATWKDGGWQR